MSRTCARCGRDVFQRALYRVNQHGEPGIFMCEECLPPSAAPDPEVLRLTRLIERGSESEESKGE